MNKETKKFKNIIDIPKITTSISLVLLIGIATQVFWGNAKKIEALESEITTIENKTTENKYKREVLSERLYEFIKEQRVVNKEQKQVNNDVINKLNDLKIILVQIKKGDN